MDELGHGGLQNGRAGGSVLQARLVGRSPTTVPRGPERVPTGSRHTDGRSSDSLARPADPRSIGHLLATASQAKAQCSNGGCRSWSPLRGSPGFPPDSLLSRLSGHRSDGPPARSRLPAPQVRQLPLASAAECVSAPVDDQHHGRSQQYQQRRQIHEHGSAGAQGPRAAQPGDPPEDGGTSDLRKL